MGISHQGSTVSFHEISYEVNVRKYPWSCPSRVAVLTNLSGVMYPGMNAIMGPTGCGKSSLLDVLAGRKDPSSLSGYVLIDGRRESANIHRHVCGYVVQDNIAINTLTVRENIAFSAALRVPSGVTAGERKAKVASVIEELGLDAVADRLLGTEYVRGISGGERKRTCIGIELVKDPAVLFLDEPTTGLDAYTAGSVMETLRRLADTGRTIVFSIHQPKYSIYRLFDRLTLIANGQIIYHGPAAQEPIEYFRQFGYILEGYNNPADFLIDTLHGEVSEAEPDENMNDIQEADDLDKNGNVPTATLREAVTRRLLGLWRQSLMCRRSLQLVTEISRRYEEQRMDLGSHPRGPVRRFANHGESFGLHTRAQPTAPVSRALPSLPMISGRASHSSKRGDPLASDISLRRLTENLQSDSDDDEGPGESQLNRRLSDGFRDLNHTPTARNVTCQDQSQTSDIRSSQPKDRSHFFPFRRTVAASNYSDMQKSLRVNKIDSAEMTQYTAEEPLLPSEACSLSVHWKDPSEQQCEDLPRTYDHEVISFVPRERAHFRGKYTPLKTPHHRLFRCDLGCNCSYHDSFGDEDERGCSLCIQRFQDSPYAASYCRQIITLGWRQCLSMIRDYRTLLTHFVIQLIVSVFLGIIYFRLDQSALSGIQNRTGLFFLTCLQVVFINSSMVDTFLRDRVIFIHEVSGGFYRISAYFFAKIVSEVLPTKALPAFLFLPITYVMAGLRHSWRAFFFWEFTLTLLTICASAIAFSVSAMVTDCRIGSMLISMFFVLMMITSGFLINVLSMGIWLRWLRFISILRYAINTLLINELSGVQFCSTDGSSLHSTRNDSVWSNISTHDDSVLSQTDSSPTALKSDLPVSDSNCVYGEQYLDTQAIEYGSHWAVWQNELGIFIIFLLALLNAYVYLRLMRKYK
ncbi:unnamed protein product [Calicophoron daubneyi]|uniref:ABC transporter domain-containing protein n=1 Tax=Calicophoron daubneyi TaxID=300641 RepID=A0AAV2TEC0_CALDB